MSFCPLIGRPTAPDERLMPAPVIAVTVLIAGNDPTSTHRLRGGTPSEIFTGVGFPGASSSARLRPGCISGMRRQLRLYGSRYTQPPESSIGAEIGSEKHDYPTLSVGETKAVRIQAQPADDVAFLRASRYADRTERWFQTPPGPRPPWTVTPCQLPAHIAYSAIGRDRRQRGAWRRTPPGLLGTPRARGPVPAGTQGARPGPAGAVSPVDAMPRGLDPCHLGEGLWTAMAGRREGASQPGLCRGASCSLDL